MNTTAGSLTNFGGNHSSQYAREVRDKYMMYFMKEGAVPWQEKVISN